MQDAFERVERDNSTNQKEAFKLEQDDFSVGEGQFNRLKVARYSYSLVAQDQVEKEVNNLSMAFQRKNRPRARKFEHVPGCQLSGDLKGDTRLGLSI